MMHVLSEEVWRVRRVRREEGGGGLKRNLSIHEQGARKEKIVMNGRHTKMESPYSMCVP
jgi:hypothetical protein